MTFVLKIMRKIIIIIIIIIIKVYNLEREISLYLLF